MDIGIDRKTLRFADGEKVTLQKVQKALLDKGQKELAEKLSKDRLAKGIYFLCNNDFRLWRHNLGYMHFIHITLII